MVTGVRYAIGLPNVGQFGDPLLLVDLAVAAEQRGWHGVFVWDHVLYREQGWPLADPTVTIAAMAAATRRVRLGVLVNAVARRRPAKLAREVATLDALSRGRMVVGAGLGSMPAEFTAFGEDGDPAVRGAKVDESLAALCALWSGEPVSYRGRHVLVDGVQMLPAPVQRPRPPIWCAGRWPARPPFRRAARWDGVMPTADGFGAGTTMPPEMLREILGYTETFRPEAARAAEAAGERAPFDVVLEGATDGGAPDRGAAVVAPYAAAGLTWWVEALGWWRGGIDAARKRIRQGPPRPL